MSIEALREMPRPSLESYMMSQQGLSPRLPMLASYLPSPYIKPEMTFTPYMNASDYTSTKLTSPFPTSATMNFDFSRKIGEDKPLDSENLTKKVKLENTSPVPSKDSFSSHSSYERAISWENTSTSLTSHPTPYTPYSQIYDTNHVDQTKSSTDLYFCHLCSYSGTSKYQFNEHMNSHFDHTCPYCDYTSRTEGRLKRHIKDFHTDDNLSNIQRTMPGRPKMFRCKQCDFVASDKVDYWTHARTHIKDEKLLQCPKCAFVTEYKHHLEYHLRNHFGSKPFKCEKCNYACVNKSMLNSHMKSHTNVYQYRCADCTYATKYCHSLKLHLRKYNHKPATILNPDGSLPQGVDAETSGVSLLSKRGPPRGPRGPRKDHFESYINGLIAMPRPSMARTRSMPVNGTMMNPFWPYLSSQFHTPGYPANPPFMYPLSHTNRYSAMANSPLLKQYPNGYSLGDDIQKETSVKCNICGFIPSHRDDLASHMVQTHASENHDLFKMFGISSDSLGMGHNDIDNRMSPREENDSTDRSRPLHVKTNYEHHGSQSCPLTWPSETHHAPDSFKYSLFRSKSLPNVWSIEGDATFYDDANSYLTSPDNSPKCQENSPKVRDDSPTVFKNSQKDSPKGADILKQMTLRFGDSGVPLKELPLDLTKPKNYSFPDLNISTFHTDHTQDYIMTKQDLKRHHDLSKVNQEKVNNLDRFCQEELQQVSESGSQDISIKERCDLDSSAKTLQNKTDPTSDSVQLDLSSVKQEVIYQDPYNSATYPQPLTEEYSPKRKLDDAEHTQDAFQDMPSPSPRKRSRKGKAYKLDTLCWKLKGLSASSPYTNLKKEDNTLSDEEKDTESDEGNCISDKTVFSQPEKVECDTTDERNLSRSIEHSLNKLNEECTNDSLQKPTIYNKYYEFSKINNIINQEILHNQRISTESTPGKNITSDNHTPSAIRRGAEIAWKILHNNDKPVESKNVDGMTNLGETLPPLCTPPALIPSDSHMIPYGEKLNDLSSKDRVIYGKDRYECGYCDIAFRDCVMYTMHMGYHGYRDPYQCNMCGHQSKNRVDFFLHIARAAHA